jgi:hypothetical protein
MFTLPLDVAGPGFLLVILGVGLGGLIIGSAVIVLVEAFILTAMRWARFGRSLVVSLMMNFASSVVGLLVIAAVTTGQLSGLLLWLFLTFVASVLLEAGVLTLLDRSRARLGLTASLVANLATYVPLAVIVWLLQRTA